MPPLHTPVVRPRLPCIVEQFVVAAVEGDEGCILRGGVMQIAWVGCALTTESVNVDGGMSTRYEQ